jgi:hypothetical protein
MPLPIMALSFTQFSPSVMKDVAEQAESRLSATYNDQRSSHEGFVTLVEWSWPYGCTCITDGRFGENCILHPLTESRNCCGIDSLLDSKRIRFSIFKFHFYGPLVF